MKIMVKISRNPIFKGNNTQHTFGLVFSVDYDLKLLITCFGTILEPYGHLHMANQPKMTEWAVLSQFWKNPIFGDFRGLVRPQTVEISGFQCQIRVQRSFLPRYGNFEPKVWSRLRFSRPLKSAIFGFQGSCPGKIGQNRPLSFML